MSEQGNRGVQNRSFSAHVPNNTNVVGENSSSFFSRGFPDPSPQSQPNRPGEPLNPLGAIGSAGSNPLGAVTLNPNLASAQMNPNINQVQKPGAAPKTSSGVLGLNLTNPSNSNSNSGSQGLGVLGLNLSGTGNMANRGAMGGMNLRMNPTPSILGGGHGGGPGSALSGLNSLINSNNPSMHGSGGSSIQQMGMSHHPSPALSAYTSQGMAERPLPNSMYGPGSQGPAFSPTAPQMQNLAHGAPHP